MKETDEKLTIFQVSIPFPIPKGSAAGNPLAEASSKELPLKIKKETKYFCCGRNIVLQF